MDMNQFLQTFQDDTSMYITATGMASVNLQSNGKPIFSKENRDAYDRTISYKLDKFAGFYSDLSDDDTCHVSFTPRASKLRNGVSDMEKHAVQQIETFRINTGVFAWQVDFYINKKSNEVSHILLSNTKTNLYREIPDDDLYTFMYRPYHFTGNPKSEKDANDLEKAQMTFMDACLDVSLRDLDAGVHNEVRDAFWKNFRKVFLGDDDNFYVSTRRTFEIHVNQDIDCTNRIEGSYEGKILTIGEQDIHYTDIETDEYMARVENVLIGLFRRMIKLDTVYKLQHPFSQRSVNERFKQVCLGQWSALKSFVYSDYEDTNKYVANYSSLRLRYPDKTSAEMDSNTWNILFGFTQERF